jgi:hypothetical protein
MTFTATIESNGKTATGFEVPDSVVEQLGSKRAKVRVTINGATYRSSVAVMGGRYLVGVSAENRALTGVAAGDVVAVALELDTEVRDVTVPADLAKALKAAGARPAFDALSYSRKRALVEPIDSAKTAETRGRRIAKAVEAVIG